MRCLESAADNSGSLMSSLFSIMKMCGALFSSLFGESGAGNSLAARSVAPAHSSGRPKLHRRADGNCGRRHSGQCNRRAATPVKCVPRPACGANEVRRHSLVVDRLHSLSFTGAGESKVYHATTGVRAVILLFLPAFMAVCA